MREDNEPLKVKKSRIPIVAARLGSNWPSVNLKLYNDRKFQKTLRRLEVKSGEGKDTVWCELTGFKETMVKAIKEVTEKKVNNPRLHVQYKEVYS